MQRDTPLLTVDEVAEIVGVDRETVVRWIRAGRLDAVILPGGRHYRIRREALEAALRPANPPSEDQP